MQTSYKAVAGIADAYGHGAELQLVPTSSIAGHTYLALAHKSSGLDTTFRMMYA